MLCGVVLAQNEEEGEDDDGEEDEGAGNGATVGEGGKKKKKKKKPTKKKAKPAGATPTQPQHIRLLTGFTDYYVAHGQTNPPTKPVGELFAKGSFPTGEVLPHGKTKYPDPNSSYARQTEEEKRYAEYMCSMSVFPRVSKQGHCCCVERRTGS
jgi:methionyl aminopeptidase